MFFEFHSTVGHRCCANNRFCRSRTKKIPLNKDGHFTTVDGYAVRKIFVANLPLAITKGKLIGVFRAFGRIIDISIIKSMNDRYRKTNFGFVTYETPAEATRALNSRHKLFISNQKIYIFPADSWHQPVVLPNGKILWDRKQNGLEDNNGDEDITNYNDEIYPNTVETETNMSERQCQISKLNDDCLLLIFDYLPLSERLVLDRVCRRWKLLNMRMWHSLTKLDFTLPPLSITPLSDKLLKLYLSLCPNITHLNIAQDIHRLTGASIVTIGNHSKKLESIAMRDMEIKKRSLALLGRSCRQLKSFHMDACANQHDGEMIAFVKHCPALEELSLKYSSISRGMWLKFVKPPLKSLSLEMYDFESEFLLGGLKNVRKTLKELKFVSCESIRSSDIESIVKIVPELSSLTVAGGFLDFKPHSLIPITKLKKLTRLELDNNGSVSEHFLNELSQQCNLLKYFSLSGLDDRYLTVEGLGFLSQLTSLTHLTLACTNKLNDAVLKSISHKLKNLQHLDLMGCVGITDEGCQSIVTNCIELEILDVSGCTNVTNLTVNTAILSYTKRTSKKPLKIIAGESGIDLDICWSSKVIVDPSSSIVSHYTSATFFTGQDLGYDEDDGIIFNNLDIDDYEDHILVDYDDSPYDSENGSSFSYPRY